MPIEKVATLQAPAAIGPYSQAVRAGDFLFFSGQIPLLPDTAELAGSDVATQVRQVLKNIEAVLGAAGLAMKDVVKTTVYLVDLGDFAVVNQVYAEYFGDAAPARATVQVAALPKQALVEIEGVAYCGA